MQIGHTRKLLYSFVAQDGAIAQVTYAAWREIAVGARMEAMAREADEASKVRLARVLMKMDAGHSKLNLQITIGQ